MEANVQVSEWPGSVQWVLYALGRFEIATTGQRPVKFRSRTAASVLAYLALHPGQEVSRFVLEETFWPQSDCDKQAQNLRRAIADLRDVLEEGRPRGSLVVTRRDVVSLEMGLIVTDVARFRELTDSGLKAHDERALLDAVNLYHGPLLSSVQEEWAYPFRLEYEERFAHVVDALCGLRVADNNATEAIRLARAALTLAPNRQDIHIALILSYRAAGLEAEAIRQFEDLEQMMDENWGEPPSKRAREALEAVESATHTPYTKLESAVLADTEPAGGAMSLTSRFYIRRAADEDAEACLDRHESVVLIQGPRQVGKSSLVARMLAYARHRGMLTAVNDFQTIGESQLIDEDRLYKTLAYSLASQLGIKLNLESSWNGWLGPNMNLDAVLESILVKAPGNVCWVLDEADRLFGRTYANDFYGLLRSWHNRRALDPDGPWGKLTLVLAYATEAHLFISDLNQSPFNVGLKLSLRDFAQAEVEELAGLYRVSDSDQIQTALEVSSGHPFLTRRALAFLCQAGSANEDKRSRSEQLRATCFLEDGPFGDHLHRILNSVTFDPEVLEEVRSVLAGEPSVNPKSRYRLVAAGVLTQAGGFRVRAYEPYLREALANPS